MLFLSYAHALFPNVGLATSSSAYTQQGLFKQLSLEYYFDAVTTGDDVHAPKPNPEAYTRTAAELNVPPSDTIVIEDTDVGICAARSAGCRPIGITTSQTAAALYTAGAEQVAHNYTDLARIVFGALHVQALSPLSFLPSSTKA